MKIGFYYHIPVCIRNHEVYVPGYLGVFLDSLASNCEVLYYIVHRARPYEEGGMDYNLKSKNIKIIDLGVKTSSWYRELFAGKILKPISKLMMDCTHLIIRSPTPLASHFPRYFKFLKIYYMVVGDYLEAIDHYKKGSIRDLAIYYYLHLNDYFFQKALKKFPILVNSPALYRKYSAFNKSIHLIRTTTLTSNDFLFREDTCHDSPIQLLYAGSFSPAKGLFELVEAFVLLNESEYNYHLNFVGWEDNTTKPVERELTQYLMNNNMDGKFTFHGKKTVGEDLYTMYRIADIYILPSYHEGFPRTIWEAMANGTPVVTTKVGGIPEVLTDRKNAILINPKNINEIVNAIVLLKSNNDLRRIIISNAYELVKDITLEKQTGLIIDILNADN